MHDISSHCSNAQLKAYLLGMLSDAEFEAVELHLEECNDCATQAAEMQPRDSLMELLTAAAKSAAATQQLTAQATLATSHARVISTSVCETVLEINAAAGSIDSEPIPPQLMNHSRYRVIRMLGRGGMGCVWLAEHLVLGRLVALKMLRGDWMQKPSTVERFDREIRAAAMLIHPNIATVYDAEQIGDSHFLVMEFVDGQTLAEIVSKGPLPVVDACRAIRDAARGLAHAHEARLIHRDVKPGNMMRMSSGETKLLDFGLVASPDGISSLTAPNLVMGTPDYISPEQAEDPHSADERSDIYSLGCTLYHLLTGHVPFPDVSVVRKIDAHRSKHVPLERLPAELRETVARMMHKVQTERFSAASDVVAALEPFCDDSVAFGAFESATPVMQYVAWKQPARPKWLVALLACVPLLFGVVVYRILTNKGELLIDADEDVEISVKQGGKEVTIYDTKSQQKLVLNSGQYELELKGEATGLKLDITKVKLIRGEVTVAKIEHILSKEAESPAGSALPAASSVAAGMTEIRRFMEGLEQPEWRSRVAFGADGNTVYAASNWFPRSVLRWDRNTGKLLSQFETNLDGFPFCLSHDRKFMVYQHAVDFALVLADAADGKVLFRLKGPSRELYRSSFSLAGDRIAAAENSPDGDAVIYVWDRQTGQLVWSRPFKSHIGCFAFSPDGKSLAVSRAETGLCICTVGTDEISDDFGVAFSQDCSFTPDGKGLVVASGTEIFVWSLSARKKVRQLTGHLYFIESLALAPDGQHLASGSADGTVRWWDLDTGEELRRVVAHPQGTLAVAVSPDSRFLLSGGKDGLVRLWRVSAPNAR